MKLLTTIKPRRTGNVIVRDFAGKEYDFKPDETGALVCEVADRSFAGYLLARGDFEPADAADFDAAEALLKSATKAATGAADDDGGAGDDDDDDDGGDFTETPNGGLPVESNTPPADANAPPAEGGANPARPRRARAAA